MAEKDLEKWQTSPAPYIRHIEELKLKKRKEHIMEELQKKRHPPNPIQGYNLHQHWKIRKKKKKQKCWSCGSTNHLKFDCPVQQKKQTPKIGGGVKPQNIPTRDCTPDNPEEQGQKKQKEKKRR